MRERVKELYHQAEELKRLGIRTNKEGKIEILSMIDDKDIDWDDIKPYEYYTSIDEAILKTRGKKMEERWNELIGIYKLRYPSAFYPLPDE